MDLVFGAHSFPCLPRHFVLRPVRRLTGGRRQVAGRRRRHSVETALFDLSSVPRTHLYVARNFSQPRIPGCHLSKAILAAPSSRLRILAVQSLPGAAIVQSGGRAAAAGFTFSRRTRFYKTVTPSQTHFRQSPMKSLTARDAGEVEARTEKTLRVSAVEKGFAI